MARAVDKTQKTIPNCMQVKLTWAVGTVSGFSYVWHGQLTSASVAAALAESLFTGFKSAFTSSGLAGSIHTDISFTGVQIKDLRTPNQPFYGSTSGVVAGTGSGSLVSIATAIGVTLATAQSGRGFFGRTYVAGLDSNALADHRTHTGPAGTQAAAWVNACMSTMSSNSVPMVIAQRALLAGTTSTGAAMGPRAAGTVAVVQAKITSQRLDSQRRRLGRH